jgi:hypothetical protein
MDIGQPESSYQQSGYTTSGRVGRSDGGVQGLPDRERAPSRGKVLHVVAGRGWAGEAAAPSLLVDGVGGSGAGALSLAAGAYG